jgi:hypothetical protein
MGPDRSTSLSSPVSRPKSGRDGRTGVGAAAVLALLAVVQGNAAPHAATKPYGCSIKY